MVYFSNVNINLQFILTFILTAEKGMATSSPGEESFPRYLFPIVLCFSSYASFRSAKTACLRFVSYSFYKLF